MNTILIDMTNIARKNAFAIVKDDPMENCVWSKWADRTLCDIISFIKQFNANRCILAMDSDNYWRKKIFPDYKINRRQFKENAIIDFDSIDKYYSNFMIEFQKYFTNIYCVRVDESEADDVIAVLTKYHSVVKQDHCTVISADKDFNQLLKYPYVTHYNPVMRKQITLFNSEKSLELKIILGDINDGIPSIRKGIGIKKAQKMIINKADILNSSDNLLVENYKRNMILIDFDFIPDDIQGKIFTDFISKTTTPVSGKSIFNFLMNYGATNALEKWQSIQDQMLNLI